MHLTCLLFSLDYDPVRCVLQCSVFYLWKWCMEGLLREVRELGLWLGVGWQAEMKNYHLNQRWTPELKPQLYI